MKRRLPVWFGLLLVFALVTSVVIAQRVAPVIFSPPNDCGPSMFACTPTAIPPPQSGGNSFNPGDPDGDGIPNGIDQCPAQGGPSSNNGCPPGTTGAQPSAPTLPTMPLTGDCVLATRSEEGVNIRVQPSTSAEIVGVLDSQVLYSVNAQHNGTDGIWYRLDEGWVARRVVRLGGDCSLLPEVTLQINSTGGVHVSQVPISCDITELINAIKNASSGATIALAPGCIYTLTQTYAGTHYGLPNIGITLTIIGNGATIRRSEAGGTPAFPIFHISDGSLTLNNLTLLHGVGWVDTSLGCSPCTAGAVFNLRGSLTLNQVSVLRNQGTAIGNFDVSATMTVSDSTFSHNSTVVGGILHYRPCGGALENYGAMTVTNSTFSNNSASTTEAAFGGALCNHVAGKLTVTNSTFSGNVVTGLHDVGHSYSGGSGGAIENDGTMTVISSTFTGNQASGGGGIANNGTATVSNSTFARNRADSGGGAIFNLGVLTVTNSTVAGNGASNLGGGSDSGVGGIDNGSILVVGSSIVSRNDGDDLYGGTITSLGYNVIGSISGASISGNTTHDLTNAAASPLHLGALADNGGSTWTMAIGAGSVAIGAGNCATMPEIPPVSTDQRGEPRKATCDAGAYEYLQYLPAR